MLNFVVGIVAGAVITFLLVAAYSMAQVADAFDRSIDRWWDEDGLD